MDPTAAHFLIENNLLVNARLYGIEKADHHLYLDNPIDTVYKMLLEVFGKDNSRVAEEYIESKRLEMNDLSSSIITSNEERAGNNNSWANNASEVVEQIIT